MARVRTARVRHRLRARPPRLDPQAPRELARGPPGAVAGPAAGQPAGGPGHRPQGELRFERPGPCPRWTATSGRGIESQVVQTRPEVAFHLPKKSRAIRPGWENDGNRETYLISLCSVWRLRKGLYFFFSMRSVTVFLLRVVR